MLRFGIVRIRDQGGFFRTNQRLYVGRRDCSPPAYLRRLEGETDRTWPGVAVLIGV